MEFLVVKKRESIVIVSKITRKALIDLGLMLVAVFFFFFFL